MKLSHLAFALPLAFTGAAAFADGSSVSQFQHQTDAGKWEVTPGFTFGSIKQNYSSTYSTTNNQTDSLFNFSVAGEYGLNDMLSVGLKLGYQTDSFSASPALNPSQSGSGMTDPVLYLNGKNDVGTGLLRWGAALDFSLGNFTLSSDGSKVNEYSGGITLTPFVGYEVANVGPGTVGVKLSYDLYQSDRSYTDNQSNTTDKLKAGNNLTLTAFYEVNFEPVIWGVDLGILNHQAEKDGNTGSSLHDGQTNFFVETYATWTVADNIAILPKIGYGPQTSPMSWSDTGATSTAGLYGTVAARFAF